MSTSGPGHTPRRYLTLAAVCLAGAALPASLTGSSVALPGIGVDLNPSLAALQWVVNAYNLTFATFMLALGALADLVGRRRMFALGGALFVLASGVSAVAPNAVLLDLARGAAGVGAAAVLTAGSALVAAAFTGPAQGRAFGLLGSSFGAGLALGPSLAGLVDGALGWRYVFAFHALLVALALLALPAITESRNPAARGVDWAGTATFTGALFCLTLALVQAPHRGWGDPGVLALAAGFLVLIAAFVLAEARQSHPMFDLDLVRQPRFVGICAMPVILAFSFVVLLILLPTYFTSAGGLSPARSGLLLMALTLPVLIVPLPAGLLAQRVPVRVLLAAALALMALGDALLTLTDVRQGAATLVAPLLLVGTGMGIAAGLLDGAAIGSVQPSRAGMAAGMFNTTRLAGETIAIVSTGALLVSLTQQRYSGRVGELGARAGAPDLAGKVVGGDLNAALASAPAVRRPVLEDFLVQQFTGALHVVFWVIAALAAIGAPLIFALLRDRSEPGPQPVAAHQPEIVAVSGP